SNNVHADAAARNFRDFSGGAEAGLENQVERVLVAHAFGFFRLDNSFFDRVGANQREIYSAAVITDFDHHLSALMIGVQINGAARGLCGTVYLNAYHQGTQVVIEVRDDGRGIDLTLVRAHAVKKG